MYAHIEIAVAFRVYFVQIALRRCICDEDCDFLLVCQVFALRNGFGRQDVHFVASGLNLGIVGGSINFYFGEA